MYMKEGEPVLGGPQVSPGNVQPTNPGVQPVGFETLQNTQNTQATPLVLSPSPTSAPSTPPVGTQLNNPVPPQPAPVSPQIPPQPLQQFPPQATTPPPSQFFTQPTTPDTGDVILSDTPPQKSHKFLILIFGSIVLLILATVAGAISIIYGTQSSIEPRESQALEEVRNSFNIYANYLLYQTDGDTAVGDISWNTDQMLFYLEGKSSSEKEAYFEKLENLYINFMKTFEENKTSIDPDNTYDALIYEIPTSLKVLKLYLSTPNLSKYAMADLYFREGSAEMISQVDQIYAPFETLNSATAIEYKNLKNTMATSIGYLYDSYQSIGCIDGRSIDKSCVAAISENDILDTQNILRETINDIATVEWEINDDLPAQSRAVYQKLYGKNTDEEASKN